MSIEKERVISAEEFTDEEVLQKSLRPKIFKEYIEQERLKEKLMVSIQAAKLR